MKLIDDDEGINNVFMRFSLKRPDKVAIRTHITWDQNGTTDTAGVYIGRQHGEANLKLTVGYYNKTLRRAYMYVGEGHVFWQPPRTVETD